VLSGLQSTSQLYQHYGDADASNLIGLFKTKFAFASDDPRMGELYSKLCGTKTTFSQQKNTSFGANEFRDGVSYNEKKETSPLVSYEEFGKLNIGECYVLLPLASVRLSRIQVPKAKLKDKNNWFVESADEQDIIDSQKPQNERLRLFYNFLMTVDLLIKRIYGKHKK
jgi:type IV secretory pathway TraG/TraD family ATPase VirD4